MKKILDKNIKYKLALFVTILGLIGLISGTSYAVLKGNTTSEREQIIKVGSVLLKLTENYESLSKKITTLSDEEGLIQEEVYSFNIKNIGDVTTKFDLKLVNKVPSDYTGEVLDEKYIKIGLEINDVEHGPFGLKEVNNIIDSNIINENEIINYKLRIWLDEEKQEELMELEDYKSFLTLEVEAEQSEYSGTVTSIEVVTASKVLTAKVGQSGLEEVTHTADSTLQIGTTEDITEYRFRGGDDVVTNNYVYFNCTDINNQSSSTCELYRIIGVFPVDDGTGNIENRVKLIKAENYGNNYWDSNGTNNWAAPATLNTTFNTTYWGTINAKYQILVGDAKYYLGGYNSTPSIRTSVMYGYERKKEGSTYYYSGNPVNWTGKIALMYASDYGYGANSACSESTNLFDYETNSCPDNNWLYLGSAEWLLPQHSGYSSYAFHVISGGFVNFTNVDNYSYAVRPVLYLKSDAQFNDIGNGSQDNPYQLKERSTSNESSSNAVYSWSTDPVSLGATKDSISGWTTDYTTLGKNYFLKHNIGSNDTVESQEVCYILNDAQYCLKGGAGGASYETNKETLFASFGEDNCSVNSDNVICSASGLSAFAYSDGNVNAYVDISECGVIDNGRAYCYGY